jgi:flavin reductase (DIM6/NTAB) family NADH-FMN oxidoreductase RutF
MKDTLRNILETQELTINHVDDAHAVAMNTTSGEWAPETSEWDVADVASAPARVVRPPRVADALAGFECRLTHAIPLGHADRRHPSSTLVVARVELFFVREGILRRDAQGHLLPADPQALDAVGRLGGIAYTRTRDRFELPRPVTDVSAKSRP